MKRSHLGLLITATLALVVLIMFTSYRAVKSLGGRNRTIETAYGPATSSISSLSLPIDPARHTSRINVGRVLRFRSLDQGDLRMFQNGSATRDVARAAPGLYFLGAQHHVADLDQRLVGADRHFYDQRLRLIDALEKVHYNRDFVLFVASGRGVHTALDVRVVTQRNDQVFIFAEVLSPQTQTTANDVSAEPYQAIVISKAGLVGEPLSFTLMIDGKTVVSTSDIIRR